MASQLRHSMEYAFTVTKQHGICLHSYNTEWNMPSQLQQSMEYACTDYAQNDNERDEEEGKTQNSKLL